MSTSSSSERRFWQTILLFVTVVALLFFVYHLSLIFMPLLIAFLLTYIWNPVVTRMSKMMPRTTAIGVLYFFFMTAMGLIVLYGVPALANQSVTFVEEGFLGEKVTKDANSNGLYDPSEGDEFEDANVNGRFDGPKFKNLVVWTEKSLERWMGQNDWKGFVRKFREGLKGTDESATVGQAAKALFSGALSGIQVVFAIASFCVLVPIYLFFLLRNMNEWNEKFRLLIPLPYRDKAVRVMNRIHSAISSFYRGQIIICVIEGTLLFLVLTALGVKLSLLFGAMYTVLAMIPYVGVLSTYALVGLFVVADTGSFGSKFVMVSALFLFIQLLESLVLQPQILGRETGLHPIVVILSIFIFSHLFGFMGLLLAVPLASATIILAQEYLLPMLHRDPEMPTEKRPRIIPPEP